MRMRSSWGLNEIALPSDVELSDDGHVRAFENANDLAVSLGHLAGADMRTTTRSPFMARSGFLRDVNVSANAFHRLIGDEESVAITVHVQAADGEFAAFANQDVLVASEFHQFTAKGQRLEHSSISSRWPPLAWNSFTSCLKEARPCGSRPICSSSEASVRRSAVLGTDSIIGGSMLPHNRTYQPKTCRTYSRLIFQLSRNGRVSLKPAGCASSMAASPLNPTSRSV